MIKLYLETSLPVALYREFREFMRILTTFLGKICTNIIRIHGRNTQIMMDFCEVVRIRMNSQKSL